MYPLADKSIGYQPDIEDAMRSFILASLTIFVFILVSGGAVPLWAQAVAEPPEPSGSPVSANANSPGHHASLWFGR